MSWETIAAKKRDTLKASIPTEWVIPTDIIPPDSQKDVTNFPKESGWFNERELEITETPAPQILLNISTGSWSSEEVTRVFCKAAAAAHQLVSLQPNAPPRCNMRQKLTGSKRQTAYPKFCLRKPSRVQRSWMNINERQVEPKAHSTASQFQSKTISILSAAIQPWDFHLSSITRRLITAP